MRVIVCGGRNCGVVPAVYAPAVARGLFADVVRRAHMERVALRAFLDGVHGTWPITLLIHGGAHGADTLAGEWARDNGIPVQVVPAEWDTHGKAAGPIRNRAMLALSPDAVIAAPGGRGTADMVKQARRAGVPVHEMSSLMEGR